MAAQEVQQGIAKIYAMDGATMVVLTGAASITMESASLTHNFDQMLLKGQDGEVETIIASNRHYTCTITFAPNGASRAAAITSMANSIAAPITRVVLSGFQVAAFNGNWNAQPGQTIELGREIAVTSTIPLIAHIKNRPTLTSDTLISG
jgi:hypothetical protein